MSEKPNFGPGNPHPLSQVKTELIWEGKYDEHGNRREVDVAGCVFPLQKVESIDEPRSHAEGVGQIDLFKKQSKRQDDFRNRLIWGDNKLVMASLLSEFKGKIDLIYIDPPFDVGADFTMKIEVGETSGEVEKDQSALEMVAYRDMWGKGADSYLHSMYESLVLLRQLLTDTGAIFIHLDVHIGPYLKVLMDEVFGKDNFQNEIAWYYYNKLHGARKKCIPKAFDQILYYLKNRNANFTFHTLAEPRDKPVKKLKYHFIDGKIINDKDENGKTITYLSTERQVDNVWRIRCLQPANKEEWANYDTQKPVDLIERILAIASNKGDLVLDVFCGSGSSLIACERNDRRWIGVDLGRFAVHTTRKRLIEEQRHLYDAQKCYRAFDVYNLGRYERQWWQKERLAGMEEEHRRIVLAFYRAEPLTGAASALLHGRKGPALIHVDGIDSILSFDELKPIAEAAHAAGAKEIHCLAWEFEMELKRSAEALEHEHNVKIRLVRIPREVMEKNRRPGVDNVPFFEMATLSAEPVVKIEGGVRIVDVKLINFLPSLSEVSSKELEALQERAVKSGFDFIDFWAVDFDHKDGQPFKHHWQDYRLRKDRSLKLQSDCGHRYENNEPHKVCVKVIDTFGCDTSILLDVPGALRQDSVQARGKK